MALAVSNFIEGSTLSGRRLTFRLFTTAHDASILRFPARCIGGRSTLRPGDHFRHQRFESAKKGGEGAVSYRRPDQRDARWRLPRSGDSGPRPAGVAHANPVHIPTGARPRL